MQYRTYFSNDTGVYLGAYAGPEENNPYLGNPSLNGQVGNAFDTLKKGNLVKGAIPLETKTMEQRIAACESALGITP